MLRIPRHPRPRRFRIWAAFDPQAVLQDERGGRDGGRQQHLIFGRERHTADLVAEQQDAQRPVVACEKRYEELRTDVGQPLALRLRQPLQRRSRR